METKNQPSANELRQYLKDAGSYDVTMNNNEMFDLYKVLELSKDTASQEDEHRSIMEETEINCSMLEDLRENSILVEEVIAATNRSDIDEFSFNGDEIEVEFNKAMESTKIFTSKSFTSPKLVFTEIPSLTPTSNANGVVTFSDINTCNPVLTTHRTLHNIKIQQKYSFPFYCRPETLAQNYHERERLIGEFHHKLLEDLNYCQKQSLYHVPWGKPIQANINFNGELDRKIQMPGDDLDDCEDNDIEGIDFEIFTSRSGRQTKRKVYTEKLNEESNLNKKVHSVNSNPIRKRVNSTTIKNDEIIKRSKLFAEPSSRAEKMFDKLLEDEPKKLEKKQEMEVFEKSLSNYLDDDENLDNDVAEIDVEEPFQRRRIEPPLFKKTLTKTKQSTRGGRGGPRKPNSKPDSSSEAEAQTYPSLENVATVIDNKIKKGVCPLCNEKFFQDELESHAATCGESLQQIGNITTRKRIAPSEIITCEACDEVFPLSTNYEVHVKECLEQSKRKQVRVK